MLSHKTPVPRPASRLLVIDRRDRLRMFRLEADSRHPAGLWITPGGGLNPGETFEEAATRELAEETGLSGVSLGPCVWVRTHVSGKAGTIAGTLYEVRERFFVARVGEVSVRGENPDEVERAVMTDHRWWALDEIVASEEAFVPRSLASLLPPILSGDYPEEPIDTGA